MAATLERTLLLPREVAKRYGVSVNKILLWIHTGELGAINVAGDRSVRPRFMVPVEAIDRFEQSRATIPPAPARKRRKRQPAGAAHEFYKK